jgi:dihydrofolate synthase/folylpolyglutamate synthase
MIEKLDKVADQITFVPFDYPRAASVEDLYLLSHSPHKQIYHEWEWAIDDHLSDLREEEMLVLTGSLYFLSQIRPYVLKKMD